MKDAKIRRAQKRDLPAILRIYNEAVRDTTATFDLEEKTLAQQRIWLKNHGDAHPVFVAVRSGEVLGWACLNPWSDRCGYRDAVEVSIYVDTPHHGKGLGKTLLKTLITSARQRKYFTLLSRISAESRVSLLLHFKFGFEVVGHLKKVGKKFGRRLDVKILQKMLKPMLKQ